MATLREVFAYILNLIQSSNKVKAETSNIPSTLKDISGRIDEKVGENN